MRITFICDEKEIAEMVEDIMCAMEYREETGTPNFELIAQNLIKAGYRKVLKYGDTV